MRNLPIILVTLFIQTASAWEGLDLTFGSDINCNYHKDAAKKDSENMMYQKCLTYKGIFDKYKPFVEHYNTQNKANAKYAMKHHDVYAEYQFKKYIYENLKYNKDIDPNGLTYNKYRWEWDAFKEVYDNIEMHQPEVMPEYRRKVRAWFEEGEGKSLLDEELRQIHRLRQRNVEEGILMKYQFRANTSYTSLLEIERELDKRGIYFEKIDFKSGL